MQQDQWEYDVQQWELFARTGSVYDYLSYKTRQAREPGKKGDTDADRNNRTGASPGQGGRSGPDPDSSDT